MARTRVSTTVDDDLLTRARNLRSELNDAALLDEALAALLARNRSAEIDASYAAAYDEHPLDEPDAWGDLASWHDAVHRS
jgi:post-segregation antitoxin (ccd killing protein)